MKKTIFLLILLFVSNGFCANAVFKNVEPETSSYFGQGGYGDQFTINERIKTVKKTGSITIKTVLTIGDSKTARNGWQDGLMTALNAEVTTDLWAYKNIGIGSTTVAYWATNIGTLLTAVNMTAPTYILINLGINEGGSPPGEVEWKANYQTIIDTLLTRWPDTDIYLAQPWSQPLDDARVIDEHDWIDELVALDTDHLHVGHNEAVWLEGGDDGATMTSDGVHYTAAGNTECISQWETVLGY
jgi:lysophospholipase L1-like esterase